jgi:colicin import membrane protein
MQFRKPPAPAPTLAIEARVVDVRAMRGAALSPQPQPPPPAAPPQQDVEPLPEQAPPQESAGPPQPTPEELAEREQQRQKEAAAQAAQQAAQEQADADRKAQEQRKQEHKAEEQKKLEEQKKARQAADAKRAAEEQRKADARAESERQADLQRSLAAETQASNAARAGPALATWQSQISAKIERSWLRPPTARSGIECMLYVTQVPGGQVTQVRIGECNGDAAVRESIASAVYRASPLPPPPDPSLFDRNLQIDFKPAD